MHVLNVVSDNGFNINTIVIAILGMVGTLGGAKILSTQRQIHTLVNSNMTELKDEVLKFKDNILSLESEVLTLRKQVLDSGGTRSDLPPTIMKSELLINEHTTKTDFPHIEPKTGGT